MISFKIEPVTIVKYDLQLLKDGQVVGLINRVDSYSQAEVLIEMLLKSIGTLDTRPPGIPQNVRISDTGLLEWDVPTDEGMGLDGFIVLKDGNYFAKIHRDVPSCQLTPMDYGFFTVHAYDAANPPNHSNASVAVEWKDRIAPPAPYDLRIDGNGILTWEASEDSVRFAVFKNHLIIDYSNFRHFDLLDHYGAISVVAYDAAGNESTHSLLIAREEPEGPIVRAGTRSVWKEPGSADDSINTPMGDQARFSSLPCFPNAPQLFNQGLNWERNVVLLNPDAPVRRVLLNNRTMKPELSRLEPVEPIQELVKVRCFHNFVFPDDSGANQVKINGICMAVDALNPRIVHHLYKAAFGYEGDWFTAGDLQTWPGDQYRHHGRLVDGPLWYGAQGGGRTRAGTVRWGEFEEGPPDHALGIITPSWVNYRIQPTLENGKECLSYDIPNTWITHAVQADNWESYTGTNPHRRAGTRYATKTDLSAQMQSLLGRWMAKVAYTHGFYQIDSGAGQIGFAYSIEQNDGQMDPAKPVGVALRTIDRLKRVHGYSPVVVKYSGYGNPPVKPDSMPLDQWKYLNDMWGILENVYPVLDNRPGNWGGAGRRRAPLKPPIRERF